MFHGVQAAKEKQKSDEDLGQMLEEQEKRKQEQQAQQLSNKVNFYQRAM